MRAWGAIFCVLWCVFAIVVIGVRAPDGRAFDTDIQSMLPASAVEPVIRAAIADASGAATQRVAVLVSGDDPRRVEAGAAALELAFLETGVIAPDRTDGAEIGAWLFANRNALMCESDPAQFDAEALLRGAKALVYTPLAPVSGELLARDPFLLTLQLGQCLAPAGGGQTGEAVLVSGSLEDSAFRIDVQDRVTEAYESWRLQWPDLSAARAGAVFFAADGARQARRDISFIAGASIVAILTLLLVCFRRPAAIFATLIAACASAAGALAAVLLVFASVHVMVFVFGSALIGVAADYTLHYLATGPQTRWATPEERVRRIFRPLTVCALSTAIGFASLGLFGVSIFNQVAVFSVAGIATAWWFTLTLLPLIDRHPRNSEKLAHWWMQLETPFRFFYWNRWQVIVGAAALVITTGFGVARFTVLDDVRKFQPRSVTLTEEGERVRDALGFSPSQTFLLSQGASADEARRYEEEALARWPRESARDILAASRFDPSAERRALNEAILRRELYAPHLPAWIDELGLEQAEPFAPAEFAPLPRMIVSLEGSAESVHYLVAPLGAVAATEEYVFSENTQLVDPVERYTQAFARFRVLAGWAVAMAFAVCALIMFLLYRTARAMIVLIAPAAGAAMAIAVPAALGEPISFFTVAALFVVVGAGIDHSVFMFEAAETDGQPKELVVFLAALTTILSMGLLGFSSTYPVQSFGLAVASGVSVAYLFSFIPNWIRRRAVRANGQN